MNYLEFRMFKDYPEIIAGITYRGDDFMHTDIHSERFLTAKANLASQLSVFERDVYFLNQVHDKEIRVIEENTPNDILSYDGLMTNCTEKLLVTCYADCVPLLFYDPVKNIVASVHSGWKGTIKRIGAEAVNKMQEVYGSNPEDVMVGIGASIGPCCFEVGEEVYREFELKIPVGAFEDKGKYFVDLWNANIEILLQAGVKRENIECKGICTCCHHDKYYSYRSGDKETGRFAAFIMLK